MRKFMYTKGHGHKNEGLRKQRLAMTFTPRPNRVQTRKATHPLDSGRRDVLDDST
ncbi:hypothetical protein BCR44DRAFT_1428597 [Catenaria anguillulae PL171]|uniref:Uncharacterized protein n=1 Tax=Catenaria anguillulae PL171 TaxID=765915 RepID=A0A1Y2HY00_9FUNG|nr:hypothetical protein BCR44DRAFT_1428597 [Catenaria anguillulae PL171]